MQKNFTQERALGELTRVEAFDRFLARDLSHFQGSSQASTDGGCQEAHVCMLVALDRLYRGTSPIRKRPPPYDPLRTPGIDLR